MLTIFKLTAFESRQITVDYNMYLIMSNVLLYEEVSFRYPLDIFTHIATGLATCVLFACDVHIVFKNQSNLL